jgi:hypothetical protein
MADRFSPAQIRRRKRHKLIEILRRYGTVKPNPDKPEIGNIKIENLKVKLRRLYNAMISQKTGWLPILLFHFSFFIFHFSFFIFHFSFFILIFDIVP